MKTLREHLPIALAWGFLAAGWLSAQAEPVAAPRPEEILTLQVHPSALTLKGSHDARQLVITATLSGGRLQDLTGQVTYSLTGDRVVTITPEGRIVPKSNGKAEIRAKLGAREVKVPVEVASCEVDPPVSFPNQVIPVFTKLGCNSGGCHGKLSGQNGFRLSLLGFDPQLDFDTLVHEGRGRRLLLGAPEQSLLLLKATGKIPHGGGKKLDKSSDDYQTIRRWIAAGAPPGKADDAVLAKVSVYPDRRVMTRQNQQQLAVWAEYSDGSHADVTRSAQYESNDIEVATVDGEGRVQTQALSGESAIMVRYQGKVTVFRATVPLGKAVPAFEFPEQTLVDRFTVKKWRELGLMPSEPCNDAQFLRRASLDITGALPTPAQVLAFSADNDPQKRTKLVDRLVDTAEYADFFAHKWADILRVSRLNQQNRIHGTFTFHGWIRQAMAADLPYDAFAREILGALGDETKSPAAVWYKDLKTPEQLVDDTSQVFLGTRIACAQCHHHPYEKWSQDDYYGMAAFFGRLKRKNVVLPGEILQNNEARQALFISTTGSVRNKRTNQESPMRPLDGTAIEVEPGDDPRQVLVDWMVDARNPFFATAVVNRYWAHFFGRGIVDPIDDMRVTNPPSNPELLDALAQDFIAHKYSLKHLVRTLCKSRTYQLSATPNEFNDRDRHAYARYYPKRMSAEVLFDAITQVTGSPPNFNGLPQDRYAPSRAIMLPDESFRSYFLDVFGRPQRLSACECERVNEANLAQVLHLLNSNEVQDRIARSGSRADLLAKDPRPDAEKVEELFLWALAHKPKDSQLQAALEHIARSGNDKKLAYENILWSLLNTKEFSFCE